MSQPLTPRQPSGPQGPARGQSSAAPQGHAPSAHSDFSRPGAIDLSKIAATSPAAPQPGQAGASTGSYVVDVTEAELNDVIQQSVNYPVILALLSANDPGSNQLRSMLTRLADESAGRWLLAVVDIDTQPRIAQALQVTAIPTVLALLAGQAIPLFQGTADGAQVRGVLEQVMASAVANGVAGHVKPVSHGEAGPDPRFAAADTAMEAEDYDRAADEFGKLLAANPKDSEAAAGQATARLMSRAANADPEATLAAAKAAPDDVPAAMAASDVDMIAGRPKDAFGRLIGLIRTTAGDERDAVRTRLLELFETMDQADPELLAARRALGAALY
ncbi:tetratricopeptide repeat protein [Propionibacterium freudenreichii]|uniref:tetratricopeptide repeat protein n=1 Tax=Propionibacterium freudenreichii TaxID=1744 RepID=UPI000542E8CC|nr:tetratricopeptide repeat protein [Propionibacterium freudenreichii]AJQ90834.1 Thioredoxin TrxA [Propionibacterium freudenreichii subsp. freudenreichii]MDK9341847.1 tetratricopeptide repeat protein [Propionibacterium freudenreichii]CEG88955.1 Thioredoxin [Propionibacterium freudenreichii]